jgi:hypothetical protein
VIAIIVIAIIVIAIIVIAIVLMTYTGARRRRKSAWAANRLGSEVAPAH